MKRFVKEYAKFRIDEINNLIELSTFPATVERLTNARSEIFQLVFYFYNNFLAISYCKILRIILKYINYES